MSKTTMRAVGVIPSKREVRLVEHPAPAITGAYDVKVRSLEVGICGTDKEICTFVYGSPPSGSDYLVLGHESIGQVVEVGGGVSVFQPGDLVVPSVRRPCPHNHCVPCKHGLQDFCFTGDFTERGIKMTHGFMTDYYVEEEEFLTFVPPELRNVAVLVEPLTVAEKGLAQVWQIQQRLPWAAPEGAEGGRGLGRRAVVLGAGPVGILGAMALLVNGFETYVYSRSPAPNPKSELLESIGAKYISSVTTPLEEFAQRVGTIDLVYEAVGVSKIAFEVLTILGTNGVFIFTGIPAPHPAIDVDADLIMRNVVLKNQVLVGTVNADRPAFQAAIRDLGTFLYRWPDALRALITSRNRIDSYQELLLSDRTGIKNIIAFD
jgi:threonine dehydrogenase-like Zn-dependent dehydrogenase